MASRKKKKVAHDQADLHRFFGAVSSHSGPVAQPDLESQPEGSAEPTTSTAADTTTCTLPQVATSDEDRGLDISNFTGGIRNIDDATKYRLIQERCPPTGYKFPPREYKDKRRQDGVMKRYCQRDWLDTFKFVAYSTAKDGLYCLCCVLFPTSAPHGQASNLVKRPHTNWKDALKDLKEHAGNCDYHKKSQAKMIAFVETMQNPERRIDLSMSSQSTNRVEKNRAFLVSVIKCLELCGRQGFALRGHRDDSSADPLSNKGNFHALLQLRVDAGDVALKEHLDTCARNATYVSKTSQNQLLECMKQYILEVIVREIDSQPFGSHYGIMADEVTDVSNWEQLGLLVRYTKDGKPVERLLLFAACEHITGRALCDTIVAELTNLNLQPANCRAQCFDGAGNMAGIRNGCAANFQQTAPRAPYFHCASHDLNLALCKACKVKEIQCMMATLKAVGLFFKYSPKRQRELESAIVDVNEGRAAADLTPLTKKKIKPMCETRWVEKHTCLEDFFQLYDALVECLQAITLEDGWDAKARTEAGGLLFQVTKPAFLCAFQTALFIFGFTKSLSALLQGSTMDVIKAYEKVNHVLTEMREIRGKAEEEFARVFQAATEMAQGVGNTMDIPRRCGRQTQRSNVEADSPEVYFRRSVFVPFVDGMVEQLATRFQQLSALACRALLLIPSNLHNLQEDHILQLQQYYEPDLPSPLSFRQELRLWKAEWQGEEDKPTSLESTTCHPSSNPRVYPNVCTMLHLLMLTPVTSAGVERANSALRYVKNVYRSTMSEDRLNALLLLFVHRDIPLDYDTIVNMYAAQHPRRMLFVNPLSE
ncbi:52 kDa repressor of the inhibitor of the protein kinase-like [Branchiostoma lanceolatum]|uniref:52 kDa repressor of the inhibitor of the protein kinase-like n=1 Tax=Branchiostoma lanceolatum TaxID=7740 RepID=UPI0034513840